jgi:HPt (histidine-containing phosphotransfer) domain-containing protein
MSSADELSKKLDQTWQKMLPLMLRRLEVIQRAHQALTHGRLTEALRIESANEAHKLAGSLGVFGRQDGSAAALEIERILSSEETQDEKSLAVLNDHLEGLERTIKSD